jgi:hypothetical protein
MGYTILEISLMSIFGIYKIFGIYWVINGYLGYYTHYLIEYMGYWILFGILWDIPYLKYL